MPDSKPTPPEDQKADSFLGRLSVVIFSSALLAILVANINLPGSDLSSETRRLLESLRTFSLLGWLAFFVIIYLSGRRSEVEAKYLKVFGKDVAQDAIIWFFPIFFAMIVYCVSWLLWRIPEGIRWVGELFRG
jgi:hypothetical protein